jgi:hypothetical protein
MLPFPGRRAAGFAAVLLCGLLSSEPGFAAAASKKADAPMVVAARDDIVAMVAPVALYPDPILGLVLQSSTLPLQLVQAERFLAKREKDKSLQPGPNWDTSVIGMLNYPKELHAMVDYLEWTEALGNAVIDDLGAVQTAIQSLRLAAYHAGFIKSSKHQRVEFRDGILRILPADAKSVVIPVYDPAALLAALDDIEKAEEAATATQSVPPTPVKAEAPGSAGTAQPMPPSAQPVYGEGALPAYATYDVTPPAISYGEPQQSYWGPGATFVGGAVIGGLLGWGLAADFDEDDAWEEWWDEDADWDNEAVEAALRDRQAYRQTAATDRRDYRQAAATNRREFRQDQSGSRRETRAEPVESREDRAARARQQIAAGSDARAHQPRPAASPAAIAKERGDGATRNVALPRAGEQAGVTEKLRKKEGVQPAVASSRSPAVKLTSPSPQRPGSATGHVAPSNVPGLAASAGSFQQVRRESERGATSRRASDSRQSASPPSFDRGEDGVQARQGRSGVRGGLAIGHDRGEMASADAARGRASRERGRGGGRANR